MMVAAMMAFAAFQVGLQLSKRSLGCADISRLKSGLNRLKIILDGVGRSRGTGRSGRIS
jgi:hypothetical protein